MKSTLLLVGGKKQTRQRYIARYLSKSLVGKSKVYLSEFKSVVIEIAKGGVVIKVDGIDIREFSLVYFLKSSRNLRMASTIAEYLDKNKIKFIDQFYKEVEAPGNKLKCIVKLGLNNILLPETLYFPRLKVIESSEAVIKKLGLPLFAKNLFNQRRKGLFLIESVGDFEKLLEEDKSTGFLFQKSVEIDKEYRLVVMGEKIVAIHEEAKRKYKGNRITFNAKESKGGWVKASAVPSKMIDISIKAAKTLNLNIAGIDACTEIGTGKIYLFEANWGPGLTLNDKISPELSGLSKYFSDLLKN